MAPHLVSGSSRWRDRHHPDGQLSPPDARLYAYDPDHYHSGLEDPLAHGATDTAPPHRMASVVLGSVLAEDLYQQPDHTVVWSNTPATDEVTKRTKCQVFPVIP